VSEVDVHGTILHSYTDVSSPHHLSLDSEGHVLVADCDNHRILVLNSQLQLQHVLVETNSQEPLHWWPPLEWPSKLCYNELTSQLYVVHDTGDSNDISLYLVYTN